MEACGPLVVMKKRCAPPIIKVAYPCSHRPNRTQRTFGLFGLLFLEALVKLASVVAQTFHRLVEDLVLGGCSGVHAAHRSIQLLVGHAAFHVPEEHSMGYSGGDVWTPQELRRMRLTEGCPQTPGL